LKLVHQLYDSRSNCYSVITECTLERYLDIIKESYNKNGLISGQRAKVTTKTAKIIRERMINDIIQGAVLPPVVLGYVSNVFFSDTNSEKIYVFNDDKINSIANDSKHISIIDGMQRTAAFIEAKETLNGSELHDLMMKKIRIELWIAKNSNNLLYRMLVLNTGQIPWNLRRQIELVYNPLIKDIEKNVEDIKLVQQDDSSKRTVAGEYPADKILELYLSFGKKSNNVDTKEQVSDEFSKLDFIKATSNTDFNQYFFNALTWMVKLDNLFSKFEKSELNGKFKIGKDLFNSQPARIGYITAVSISIMDYPGLSKTSDEQQTSFLELKKTIDNLFIDLEKMNSHQMEKFLDFATLNERLDTQSSKIGAFERDVFTKAFYFLFNNLKDKDFSNITLEACWRAS